MAIRDLAWGLGLMGLALAWFNRVLFASLSGKTVLPYDNLYAFEPWRGVRPDVVPYNPLISDMVLENVPWALHARRAFAAGVLPLWNPDVLSGAPFLAGVLYPPAWLLVALPLEEGFAWFIALHVALAGVGMYVLGRTLGVQRAAAGFGAVAFMLGGYMITNATFPQVIAAAAWTPLLLAIVERMARFRLASLRSLPVEEEENQEGSWTSGVGGQQTGGPAERGVAGPIASLAPPREGGAGQGDRGRLAASLRSLRLEEEKDQQRSGTSAGAGQHGAGARLWAAGHARSKSSSDDQWLWVAGAVCVGLSLLAGHVETALYGVITVLGYGAVRLRGRVVGVTTFVGVGTALAGVALLPLAEALLGSARVGARSADDLARLAWPVQQLWTLFLPDLFGNPTHRAADTGATIFWGAKNYVEGGNYLGVLTLILAAVGLIQRKRDTALLFGAIAGLALLLVLGSPLYLAFSVLPGGDQLRTPFRWICLFSIAVSVLAMLGLDALLRRGLARRLIAITATMSVLILGTLAVSVVVPDRFLKLAQRFVTDPAWSLRAFGPAGLFIPQALPTADLFWDYERMGLLRLALGLALSAFALLTLRSRFGALVAICVVALDLYSVHGAFLPQTDLSLSPMRHRPPVVDAIDSMSGNQPWRFTTFERGDEKTFLSNAGMFYDWQDVRGYDSIISRDYATFTERLGLTPESLMYNRVAPVYDPRALDSELLDMLNVRYVLTEQRLDDPKFHEVYRDSHIAAYENLNARARAFVEGASGTTRFVEYAMNEVEVEASVDAPATLVLADTYADGWRATLTDERTSSNEAAVERVYDALRAVQLPSAGTWRVRFAYEPLGWRFGAVMSSAAAVVLLGVALRGVTSRSLASGIGRSVSNRPLRAPYSPADRGA